MPQRPLRRRRHLHLAQLGDCEVQVLDGGGALVGVILPILTNVSLVSFVWETVDLASDAFAWHGSAIILRTSQSVNEKREGRTFSHRVLRPPRHYSLLFAASPLTARWRWTTLPPCLTS